MKTITVEDARVETILACLHEQLKCYRADLSKPEFQGEEDIEFLTTEIRNVIELAQNIQEQTATHFITFE